MAKKEELVPVLKVALLRMQSQEVAHLLGNLLHEEAFPLAMDAVEQGQALFYPSSTSQLVPLYLMAIQANLGLGRTTQSEDLLGLAAWLLLQDTKSAHYGTQAELSRLFGQLYMLQGESEVALKAFSEEVYYNALEHGVLDTRTSLGFFHLCEVFRKLVILAQRAEVYGGLHVCVAEASFVLGLLYLYTNQHDMAYTTLEHASALFKEKDAKIFDLVKRAMKMVPVCESRVG